MIWLDILIFAAVAVFLAFRLNRVLGERHGEERERPNPFAYDPTAQAPQPTTLPAPDAPASDTPLTNPAPHTPMPPAEALPPVETLAGRLARIQAADPNFNEKSFLAGARGAFELIVTAFAKGDTATLRPLLGDDVYDSFAAAIRARQSAGETLETRILKIRSIDLLDASLQINTARVTLRIVSEQISVTRNTQDEVVDGHASNSIELTDRWTFARNTRALDPNWQLVQTQAEG